MAIGDPNDVAGFRSAGHTNPPPGGSVQGGGEQIPSAPTHGHAHSQQQPLFRGTIPPQAQQQARVNAPQIQMAPQLQRIFGGMSLAIAMQVASFIAAQAEPYFLAFIQHLLDLRKQNNGGDGESPPSQ